MGAGFWVSSWLSVGLTCLLHTQCHPNSMLYVSDVQMVAGCVQSRQSFFRIPDVASIIFACHLRGCGVQKACWCLLRPSRLFQMLPFTLSYCHDPNARDCAYRDLNLEFEIPFRELGFHGVPHKSTAFVMPTVNCLVELVESPATVVAMPAVAIVNLERVGFNLRNFDMVIVFKVCAPSLHLSCVRYDIWV